METLNLREQYENLQSVESLSREVAFGVEVVQAIVSDNAILKGGREKEAYFAGGFARDLLLGKVPKDIDIATSLTPDELLSCAELNQVPDIRLTMIDAAEAYPVIQAKKDNLVLEIASFRKDVYLDDDQNRGQNLRKPTEMQIGASLIEDVQRRDLTINSLMFNPLTGQVIDPLTSQQSDQPQSGISDLENKIIRFVGQPRDRILEDRVRLLRAIRFKNRYDGFEYAPETEKALIKLRNEIEKISPDRIRDELNKMLIGNPNRIKVIEDLDRFGILEIIMPEFTAAKGVRQPQEYHSEGDVWAHQLLTFKNLPANANSHLVWATLLHDLGKVTTAKFDTEKGQNIFYGHEDDSVAIGRKILRNLKFSNEDVDAILWLVKNHMNVRNITGMRPNNQKKLALPHRFDVHIKREDLALDLLTLLWADNQSSLRPDGAVDQNSFKQAETIIRQIQEQAKNAPMNIKEGLNIDGLVLIERLKIIKQQQNKITELMRYLNTEYQDHPEITQERVLNMADNWWYHNVF